MKEKENPKEEFKKSSYDIEEAYSNRGSVAIPEKFGLCSKCDNLNYAVYEHGKELMSCRYSDDMTLWASGERMVNCSRFSKRGETSLVEMANLAYYIDGNKKKIGFK